MYASSVLTSPTIPSGKEMISNHASCFGHALSGCSVITVNVLLAVISKVSGVEIPDYHRTSEEVVPGTITTVRHHEAGATICEEVTSNLVCHTVYPLEVAEFCTPGVFESWIHRIEECAKLKLKQFGCQIENLSDVTRCQGLQENVTQCIKEMEDTPCRQMKLKIFNIGIPMVISVPKSFSPLVKGNKEHIRTSVQDCMNSLDEEAVNKCVPNLYDALASIAMENPAYRPHSLTSQRNSACLEPQFHSCNLLSRESLQQHIAKEFGVFVNLTFSASNVKWFSEISSGSGKVTVFGVQELQGKESQHVMKKSCSQKELSQWEDSLTKCLSDAVVDLGLHDPHALTLKRIIDETNKCIDKEGPLPCHLETRTDYEHLLTFLLDLIRHHTVLKRDHRSVISLWKRAFGRHGGDSDEKCHDSLKYENIRHCAHNIYMYLTLLESSPNSVSAVARENEKNQDCLSHSLKDCPKPVTEGIMSVFMRAIGHHPRETRDVLGATPYRHKRLVSIHPMYGGVVTVCEEETHAMPPKTTPMFAREPTEEIKITRRSKVHAPITIIKTEATRGTTTSTLPTTAVPHPEIVLQYTREHHPISKVSTATTMKTREHTKKHHHTKSSAKIPTTKTKPLPTNFFQQHITEEEFAETVTEPTSSPQCTEEEVEAWMEKTEACCRVRLFQLYKSYEDTCFEGDSSSIFGNMSLCVSEMQPLMAQCGHDRFYVFESTMEHLQKVIQMLQSEATQKCENTNFCLPDKLQLVKCAGTFYDHMKEMKDSGKNYESSQDLSSMNDVDQCLAAEMTKCAETEKTTFKEIVFITYGVEIKESSKQVNGNSEYCFTYTPGETSIARTKTVDFRTKQECSRYDANQWLNRIRKCLDGRIKTLQKKSLKIKEVTSKRVFHYIELCIHVHRILPCKPSNIKVFEPLFKELLSNSKQDLMKLVETLKSQTPNVQDAVQCIEQLDNQNMQNCIPILFKDMNYVYSTPSAEMEGWESQRCVANAVPKCSDKTLSSIDYALKSAMGILHPSEKPQEETLEETNICRFTKAADLGNRACTSSDLHTELQYISHCLENASRSSSSVTLDSGITETEKCVQKYMRGTCYIADAKLLSRMVEYTLVVMIDFMKKHLSKEDSACVKLISGSQISKCTTLYYKYINSLRNGEIVGAMAVASEVLECIHQALKECPEPVRNKIAQMLGQTGRVSFQTFPSTNMGNTIKYEKEIRINRDVSDELVEYNLDDLLNNIQEEFFSETDREDETENSKVRRVREAADDPDTTLETLRDDVATDERPKEERNEEEYTVMQGQDENDNITKIDLVALKECNSSAFRGWINNYHECFVASKYKDSGRDLNNIIRRILVNVEDCMKSSLDKRCFPSWIQVEEFLGEVVSQAKDYTEMYLSQITKGREDIVDLPCMEKLSVEGYQNCTSNIFKFLDYYRNHFVRFSGLEEHIDKTAVCMRYSNEDCSKRASTTLIQVVEVLLHLSNGTIGNRTVIFQIEETPTKSKSVGEKIVDFFKDVAKAIAKPFIWLYNTIASWFHW